MKKILLYFLILFLIESLSFLGFLYPALNTAGFFVIVVIAILLSVEKLRYGLLILLAELFIGSKGYLFSYEHEGALFSVRLALFLVVISAWFGKVVLNWIDISQAPRLELEPWMKKGRQFVRQDLRQAHKKITTKHTVYPAYIMPLANLGLFLSRSALKWCETINILCSGVYFYYALLFGALIWGVFNGYWRDNSFAALFFDMNGWIYLGIIFPFAYLLKHQKKDFESFFEDLFWLFTAATAWLSLKTLALFYIFSHDFSRVADVVYRWVRVTGVGEITSTGGGFSRIFLQSQVYAVIALLLFSALLLYALLEKKRRLLFYCFIVLLFSAATVLVSLSRSFWVGLAVSLLFSCFLVFLFYYREWKKLLIYAATITVAALLGFALLAGMAAFPYPSPGIFNAGIFKDRISDLTGEAAVASRWNLLPVLMREIKEAPVLGKGFGAQVTYVTQDPRVLQQNPSGEYTTYAFEWGWLDIWLKLGLIGVLAYLVLLGKVFIDGFLRLKAADDRLQMLITVALLSGLVLFIVTNIFSPYLNHPLGIGYVVLVSIILTAHT